MKSKQFNYWIPERQTKLWEMYISSNGGELQRAKKLSKVFGKTVAEIFNVLQFLKREKGFVKAEYYENGIRVTKYSAGYAHGVANQCSANGKNGNGY